MLRLLTRVSVALLLALAAQPARAFSLLGPFAPWQVDLIGYNLPGADLGGPMNLGEEYRYNTPVLTYGFDESFINFFGARGVEEVEKAFKTLNELPPISQMSADLSEFPLDTRRFNHRANALRLIDLRSHALASMMEQLGLAPAERYVWTLRSRIILGATPYYTVIKRNFDPVTWEPSSYVNGALFTYFILQTWLSPEAWEAVEFDVDPTRPSVSSLSSIMINGGTVLAVGAYASIWYGLFYTGLTRDDVGGLRYLLRPTNINMETLGTNTVRAPVGSASGNSIIGPNTGFSPWGPPGGVSFLTNLTGTNVTGTNAVAPFDPALRRGVDKLTFVRVDYDSFTGFWIPLTNRWEDHYITNGVQRQQLVERTLLQPDFLISAQDLGIVGVPPLPYLFSRSIGFVNHDAINGSVVLDGPGTIVPPVVMAFGKLGPYLWHIGEGSEADGITDFWWGSYDGTTDEPVVYPSGSSIKEIERLILTGAASEGRSPWMPPGSGP